MTKPLDFQTIIMTLQHFWADQGCLIWQPYYSQVGAGTMNPATALRVLGPEPWNVAYVEPSIRPDDGRYGENPNRMQMHYQFQVILKPDPGNPQEIYLKSLEALGIDLRQHDIRFVEDKWESPALGAWGLGWEVWLDGQEITQFTYFQQAGGKPCNPVSVEITYGLDRIAIALQRVHGFTAIRWNDSLTCGDVNLQAEQEHSKYYFEGADVERLRQMYQLFAQEAEACLAQNLILPAHDYVLKCSHTFNVLDSRGAIGVTERQAYFGNMRDLSRRVADAYLDQRQRLEFPWLEQREDQPKPAAKEIAFTLSLSPADFLLEIGTEELPVGDLDAALEQLQTRLLLMLDELRLDHGFIRVQGTPRRLVVHVEQLASRQPDIEQVVKGPPADRAFDAFGQPTKAAEGFARSKGLQVSELQVREMDGGRYVTAVIQQAGRPTPSVLAEALPELIAALRFEKPMRWNESNVAFSRPIRWLLALYGEQVIPFSYAGLSSRNITRTLRIKDPVEIVIHNPKEYFKVLADQGILLEKSQRSQSILTQVKNLAEEVDGVVIEDPALVDEIANLVEAPGALRGAFDPGHLALPRPVLISVMKKHQRFFPVEREGKLLPYFITVANRPSSDDHANTSADIIIDGNEHVIRARFADADFFIKDDRKHSLEDFLPRLNTLSFQVKLGSMLDKTGRIVTLTEPLSTQLGLTAEQALAAQRAAQLCKADLATKMVVEMTSLQGVMGSFYALQSGESEAIADAIYEHYLPRFTGDILPATLPGLVVGLADRLDSLMGLFAVGLAPTGTKDPFALRRSALGLVQALIGTNQDFNLRAGITSTASLLPIPASPESQAACLTFMVERLRNLLLDSGNRYDIVDAILAAQGHNPARATQAVLDLARWVARPDWSSILPAYARCVRITRDLNEHYPVNLDAFTEHEERELFAALQTAEAAPRRLNNVDDFLNTFLPMIPVINRFFDAVLVMAEDVNLRQNRLGMLQRIAALADGVADLSRLEGF